MQRGVEGEEGVCWCGGGGDEGVCALAWWACAGGGEDGVWVCVCVCGGGGGWLRFSGEVMVVLEVGVVGEGAAWGTRCKGTTTVCLGGWGL